MVLYDPECRLYAARDRSRTWRGNDRPQHFVDFIATVTFGAPKPPFILVTDKPPLAIDVPAVARAFALDSFYICDGSTLAVSADPILRESEPDPETLQMGYLQTENILPSVI